MKVQNADIVACLRSCNPRRTHAVCVDCLGEGSPGWARHEWLKQPQAPAECLDRYGPVLSPILEQAQGEPQCFRSDAHQLPSIMLTGESNDAPLEHTRVSGAANVRSWPKADMRVDVLDVRFER